MCIALACVHALVGAGKAEVCVRGKKKREEEEGGGDDGGGEGKGVGGW